MAARHEGLDLPTTMRARMPDGRCIGADNSVWLYRKVPLGPVDDAVDTATALAVGAPLMDAFDELESMARVRVNRRRMASGAYRHIHLQLVNIPQRFDVDKKQPLREWLTTQFPKAPVDRRVLLLGVRLRDEIGGGGGFAAMADSVIQTLVSSEVPLSDFDRDFQMVDAALSRAGLTTPSNEDFRLANAWWNTGKYPDTPTLVHSDHLHVFTSPESLTEAAALEEDRVPCRNWPKLPRHGTVSMVAVQDLNFRPTKAGDPGINWFSELLSLNAIAVSVRASIEPQKVTRAELRANRKGYIDDINEASREGKMQRSEQDETLAYLGEMEGIYAKEGAATPTLVDASCVAALNGVDVNGRYDATGIGRSITLSNLVERQSKAMTETMLCSSVRANPHLHDWPAQAVSMTGAPSLSVVGDTSGALLGFTERDRQPAYISPTAASTADGLPLMLVAGATGSGKTQALLWMAYQFAQPCENPELKNSWAGSQIILDPKQKSDHSDVVKAAGGQVVSLDDLMSADGVFDPLRFAGNAEAGIEAASSMLMKVNPWGGRKDDFETDLAVALTYGVAEGATCVGQALKIALDAGRAKPEMVQPVLDLAVASPMFSACVGMDPQTEGLRVSEGITLIKVGDTYLDLPQPGKHPDSMGQRIAVALVRMMVYGSAMALTGRRGVLHMDEAWIFLLGGASEVERLGRLARSQEVLPVMYTQRVSDAVNAGLNGYISRGLILAIQDKDEARAACELFELEPTPYRMGRITAKATKSGSDSSRTGAPNWNSLRALRDPETRKVLRGSVGIYVDLDGRAVPTVITLPPQFLKMSSTNTADLREKGEEKQRRAAQGLAEVMPLPGVEEAHAEVAEQAAEQMARHTQAMASSLDDTGAPDTEPEVAELLDTRVETSPVEEDDDWDDLRNLG